ncbi:glycosyltransferase [Lachnospiraceae bacterium WCA-9-b2]|jgi:Predicted glycosyltransferases|uniref:Glycosyltransferase n=1 Tax=Sporofaciens musculi TaxID=2681861 RepID=A0A7X3MDK2_9FIRM|nr:glycosyltransferase [Sporofaciens musculi]MXP74448.1 glycosyltransferase [Sporofaciens musculi]
MTAFVILHYRAIEMTRTCVERIKALEGKSHIVIVDNASPNGTGRILEKEYEKEKMITVLLNQENGGFARGNNLGICWVCSHLKADFVVVLNNDVEIVQKDFAVQIGEIFKEHPFDVLGPDILSVFSGIHQSPKSLHGCTLESVRRKYAKVKKSSNPILLLLSSGEKNSPAIWKRVQRRQRAKQKIDSSVSAEGVVLHGSCVIFSHRYLAAHPEPFFPKTYMYYEMEILEWLCRREGNVIRYDPSISVLHYQYVASKQEYKSIVKRSKFVIECLLDSLKAAEELILEDSGEEKA